MCRLILPSGVVWTARTSPTFWPSEEKAMRPTRALAAAGDCTDLGGVAGFCSGGVGAGVGSGLLMGGFSAGGAGSGACATAARLAALTRAAAPRRRKGLRLDMTDTP